MLLLILLSYDSCIIAYFSGLSFCTKRRILCIQPVKIPHDIEWGEAGSFAR